MPSFEYPTKKNVENFTINSVYLRADDDTVNQYCTENGITLVDYVAENQRFSNDGTLVYVYYDLPNTEWKIASGFDKVVATLNYS